MNTLINNNPLYLEVNLDNLAHNIREIKNSIGKNTMIMAIVKANGYGHGSRHVSKVFLENGADYLGVSTLSEGIELRREGINSKILVLNRTLRENYNQLLEYDLIQNIYNYEDASVLSQRALEMGREAIIHVKIDTGLSRLGFLPNEKSIEDILRIGTLKNIKVEGIFSHFAMADERDKSFSREQYRKFIEVVEKLKTKGMDIPIKHMSSSGAILDLPEFNLDMIRPGIILYGYYPSDQVNKEKLALKPALTLKAKITNVKKVDKNTGVSYGQIFTTERESTIVTLPIGYGDGYSRGLIGKGEVFLKDKRVPIIGKICMDQMMVDGTEVEELNIGDEAIIFGYEKNYPSIDELANDLNTINYEILTTIGRRVPRIYIKDEEIIKILDYLTE